MCKTSVTIDFYYVNICKHEHGKNMTRLWCKIVLKTGVEQIEGNERFHFYFYPFGHLTQGLIINVNIYVTLYIFNRYYIFKIYYLC